MRPACDRRTPLPLIVLSVCAFIGGTAGWWLAALQALAEPTGEASSVARIELQTETLPTLPVMAHSA